MTAEECFRFLSLWGGPGGVLSYWSQMQDKAAGSLIGRWEVCVFLIVVRAVSSNLWWRRRWPWEQLKLIVKQRWPTNGKFSQYRARVQILPWNFSFKGDLMWLYMRLHMLTCTWRVMYIFLPVVSHYSTHVQVHQETQQCTNKAVADWGYTQYEKHWKQVFNIRGMAIK